MSRDGTAGRKNDIELLSGGAGPNFGYLLGECHWIEWFSDNIERAQGLELGYFRWLHFRGEKDYRDGRSSGVGA